ncbi:MAG: cysteine desulfuration [Trebouxia sp. A1-2]|nr:MAG: cysteine desulfuration [Trebouxia sp. A1-2]
MQLARCNALHHASCPVHRLPPAARDHTSSGIRRNFSRKHAARKHGRIQASATVDSGVPQELEKIIGGFQMVPDPKIKYQQLLFYAKKLKPMAAALHTEANKVQGCVSQAMADVQVWVHPRVEAGKIFWEADSDSALTKGLAALLVQGLSGSTAADIVAIPPDFIERLGLQQSLTPSRNNGFLNMFRLMQRKSLDLVQTEQHGAQEAADMPKPVPSDSMVEQPIQASPADLKTQEVVEKESPDEHTMLTIEAQTPEECKTR